MSKDELDEIGARAAEIYGQEWNAIPVHSQILWRNLIADTQPGDGGGSPMEQAAAQAVREFHTQAAPVAPEEAPKGKEKPAAKAEKPKK